MVLDEGDGAGFFPPVGTNFLAYFKRSWPLRKDGKYAGPAKRHARNYWPMAYSVSDDYTAPLFGHLHVKGHGDTLRLAPADLRQYDVSAFAIPCQCSFNFQLTNQIESFKGMRPSALPLGSHSSSSSQRLQTPNSGELYVASAPDAAGADSRGVLGHQSSGQLGAHRERRRDRGGKHWPTQGNQQGLLLDLGASENHRHLQPQQLVNNVVVDGDKESS